MEDVVVPPTYTINLSLPPRERYIRVAIDYLSILHLLPSLFDNLVAVSKLPVKPLHILTRLLFRRLHSFEQTEELRGISEASNIPLYLLVTWNIVIDAVMGCTSGGAAVSMPGFQDTTMMHFRALDWPQHVFRNAIAQFEFVDRAGGDVIARTLGYVGHVGVLTGVRKGLSVSLNLRPCHNSSLISAERAKSYWYTLMVATGRKPGISTLLRDCMLPKPIKEPNRRRKLVKKRKHDDEKGSVPIELLPAYDLDDVINILPTMRTPSAYVILSTAAETVILEKDSVGANILRSSSFIATTNHDASLDNDPQATEAQVTDTKTLKPQFFAAVRDAAFTKSIERKRLLIERWMEWKEEQARQGGEDQTDIGLVRLLELVRFFPLVNSRTHFLCIMDPREGVFSWVEQFAEGQAKRERA